MSSKDGLVQAFTFGHPHPVPSHDHIHGHAAGKHNGRRRHSIASVESGAGTGTMAGGNARRQSGFHADL